MTRLEAALLEAISHLEARRIRYMVIGGIANLRWGRPRLTEDIDVKIDAPEASWPEVVAAAARGFRMLVDDPLGFVRDTRVLPLQTRNGVRVDLVMADLPYEGEAMERAVTLPVAGRPVRVCSAEDLILHKLASTRSRDRDDVEGVIALRHASLDRGYLDPRVEELAERLEQPEIAAFYRASLERAESAPPPP